MAQTVDADDGRNVEHRIIRRFQKTACVTDLYVLDVLDNGFSEIFVKEENQH